MAIQVPPTPPSTPLRGTFVDTKSVRISLFISTELTVASIQIARITQIRVVGNNIVVTVLKHNNFEGFPWTQVRELPDLKAELDPNLIEVVEALLANPQALGSNVVLFCGMEPIDLALCGRAQLIRTSCL